MVFFFVWGSWEIEKVGGLLWCIGIRDRRYFYMYGGLVEYEFIREK